MVNNMTSCISSVQFSHSVMSDSATPWTAAPQASLSITNSRSSLRLMSIESVMPSSHLILGRPLLLLPPIPPSIRVFSNESTLRIRWPKYWSFSFSIIPSKEIPGLISFRNGLVGSPCNPRDSQESSPTPQFKSINSSALSFLKAIQMYPLIVLEIRIPPEILGESFPCLFHLLDTTCIPWPVAPHFSDPCFWCHGQPLTVILLAFSYKNLCDYIESVIII